MVLCVVLAVGSCDDKPRSEDESRSASDDDSASSKRKKRPRKGAVDDEQPSPERDAGSAGGEPVGERSDGDGAAYFAVDDVGIVRLAGGRVTLVHKVGLVRDMVLGPDGQLWASSFKGVVRIDGERANQISNDSCNELAVVDASDAWAVNFKGVAHYDGAGWTTEAKDKVGATGFVADVAVDGSGVLHVFSSDGVFRRKAVGRYKKEDLSLLVANKPLFRSALVGPDKMLYASYSRGIMKSAGDGKWIQYADRVGHMAPGRLAINGDRLMAAVSGLDRVLLVPAGGSPKSITAGSAGFKATKVVDVGVDDGGRIWVATDHGLVVLSSTGAFEQQFEPGTVDGIDGAITHIAVKGRPALPPRSPLRRGNVEGRVVRGNTPVEGAQVELCANPAVFNKASPCQDNAFQRRGVTAADGGFEFSDVPISSYRIAIKPSGGKWRTAIFGVKCCAQMKHDETLDLGPIKLRAP